MDPTRWVAEVGQQVPNVARGAREVARAVPVPFGGETVTYVLGLLPPLALATVVLWDATTRDVRRRFTWAGGVLVATVAPVFGAYVVGLLYFLVNRGRGVRARSTGALLGAWGVVVGVLLVPYALSYAHDPLLAVVGLVPVVLLLLVWFGFGGR